jgi:predicted NAD/FAD-binding protein
MRIAIIGTGVAGVVAARELSTDHEITVFEAAGRIGGHVNTVDVELDDGDFAVDTGFIVHNDRNYPILTALFEELGVETQPSDMSFSVADPVRGVEWAGATSAGVFPEARRVVDAGHLRMLADIVRFNRSARRWLAENPADDTTTLAELLALGNWSERFRNHYLIPLGAAVWSADPSSFDLFGARALLSFLDHHGLLELTGRPQWRTITGGARRWVEAATAPFADRIHTATPVRRILRDPAGVDVTTDRGTDRFDGVVMAVHSDQALAILGDPTPVEEEILGAVRYQDNDAVLHTDASLLPSARRAWASWNVLVDGVDRGRVAVTYHMNRLQRIDSRHEICVTLNATDLVDPSTVLGRFRYAHPVFDVAAMDAQRRRARIQGVRRTWYAGAWLGYGFHEDGARSAHEAVSSIRMASVA